MALSPLLALLISLAGAEEPAVQERPCLRVHSPLPAQDRRSFAELDARISSGFGDGRRSYRPGHLHAGIDLRTRASEPVHAICPGRVADVHLAFPHLTVVVEHTSEQGQRFYSSYKHVAELQVAVGDRVEETTQLARVFDEQEQRSAPWSQNHLHFEIRRSIEDGGVASFASMSMEELERYAMDPRIFFRERLK